MDSNTIQKQINKFPVQPNLIDYNQARENFSWDDIAQKFDYLPNGGLNIAYEAIDRHANGKNKDKEALVWLGAEGTRKVFTFSDMKKLTSKFANVLKNLGIKKEERVFTLSPRVPEIYIGVMGILKNGSVLCPLFSQFGPEPILQRMQRGDAKLLITTQKLYEKKVIPILDQIPQLKYILIIDANQDIDDKVLSLHKLLDAASQEFEVVNTAPEDMSILHFTSGTTGMPKGVVHVHKAVFQHYMTGLYVLDFHENDRYWCTADPGWVTGTSYGIISPWVHGVTNIVDEAEFDAARWYKTLQDEKVTVWYTAPTAIRRLMRIENEPLKEYDLSNLRLIHSVGEPLNPEAVIWGTKKLNMPIHDNWWQTETGGMIVANLNSQDIKPGSMGRVLPGIEASIIRVDENGVVSEAANGKEGDLAIKKGWPSMFRAYLHNEEKYKKSFAEDWYISGDLAYKDSDGYFWFVGRADDIIKTSGHMVGPFEVESALMEHPAVVEAGVIGKPDDMIGQVVKAFVSIKEGFDADDKLKRDIIGFARKKLGAAIAPKEIEFQQNLPKTRSGKIMRRLLKARELGLEEGDTSTLEK